MELARASILAFFQIDTMMDEMADPPASIPIKLAELSIQKFNESGVPHHLSLLKNHKSNIEKSLALGDYDKIKKEEISATRVIKQLKTLLMEMDVLRRKLHSGDVAKFDSQILVSRQNALAEINSYLGLFCFDFSIDAIITLLVIFVFFPAYRN